MGALTPTETRLNDKDGIAHCHVDHLKLPLRWPTPPGTPDSPKRSYRSWYEYQDWDKTEIKAHWSHFDWLLRLVDFSGLRPVLAQRLGWHSARGQVPFDPVSVFLLIEWQIHSHWSRATVLRHLVDPRYADYAHDFGFHDGIFPTEGALRYYLTTLGRNSERDGYMVMLDQQAHLIQALNQMLAQSVELYHQADLLSPEAWDKALICPDGMLHSAASRMRCSSVTDTCYQPLQPGHTRPCPARDKAQVGCKCDSPACVSMCQHAAARDVQARLVHYSGSNKDHTHPNASADPNRPPASKRHGKFCFGYRSLPLQLADSQRRFSLVLLDDVQPANQVEAPPVAAELLHVQNAYPTLNVAVVAGDAAFGYDQVLSIVYNDLKALRVIDLRAHDTDKDKSQWSLRGYDDKGRPVCPYGYPMVANGFDSSRRRHKWICDHACLKGKPPVCAVEELPSPPHECPYQDRSCYPHGRIVNLAQSFPDGSMRLLRDVPFGSKAWRRYYHRARNAVEGRNATFETWQLKRMPVYGMPRVRALVFLADICLNLTTLARLIAEATKATHPP